MEVEISLREQIIYCLYQLKLAGINSISAGDIMLLLGISEEEIPEEDFHTMVEMPEEQMVLGELIQAKLNNQVN